MKKLLTVVAAFYCLAAPSFAQVSEVGRSRFRESFWSINATYFAGTPTYPFSGVAPESSTNLAFGFNYFHQLDNRTTGLGVIGSADLFLHSPSTGDAIPIMLVHAGLGSYVNWGKSSPFSSLFSAQIGYGFGLADVQSSSVGEISQSQQDGGFSYKVSASIIFSRILSLSVGYGSVNIRKVTTTVNSETSSVAQLSIASPTISLGVNFPVFSKKDQKEEDESHLR